MRTFVLTNPAYDGEVTFTYNDNGYLIAFKMPESMGQQQWVWLKQRFPWVIENLSLMMAETKRSTLVEQEITITFAMFWDKYNDKDRSSKKKTELAWNKKSKTDQVKAYYFIDTYKKNRGTAELKHATTYLADELWNN